MSTDRIEQFRLRSVGVVMEADPDRPAEAWGVLNPGSARTPGGELLLYPRAVAEGNFSRIEIVRVKGDEAVTKGVQRLGYALEPHEPYEHHLRSQGGVEDPRVSFLRPLGVYVMAYVALGQHGPRIALAISKNGTEWKRLGLLTFRREANVDWSEYGNKDAAFFPDVVHDATGDPCLAILHRPTYLVPRPDGQIEKVLPEGVDDDRGSIWMSCVSLEAALKDLSALTATYHSILIATPEADWEQLKIGAGTPPMLTSQGWVLYYHGVQGTEPAPNDATKNVCYRVGVMILDRDDPGKVIYRSTSPVLSPESPHELVGVVPSVVFPTALDVVGRRIFVYYGAADCRVAVATATLEDEVLIAPSAP